MTINNPKIAAGSTVSRESTETAVGRITNAAPPSLATVVKDNEVQFIYQTPEREGQIVFHKNSRDFVTAYVVVRIERPLPYIFDWELVNVVSDDDIGLWAQHGVATVDTRGSSGILRVNAIDSNGNDFGPRADEAVEANGGLVRDIPVYSSQGVGSSNNWTLHEVDLSYLSTSTQKGLRFDELSNFVYSKNRLSLSFSDPSNLPSTVETSSRLEWVRVEPNTLALDPRTGEVKDPLIGFFSYLAD